MPENNNDDLDLRVVRGELGSAMMQMKMQVSTELNDEDLF